MASITKVMTLICALRLISKWKLNIETITLRVSQTAGYLQGTTANLFEGDTIYLEDLLYGMMLPSGNDAAYTIAENFGAFLYLESTGKIEYLKSIVDFDVNKEGLGNINAV